MDTQTIILLLLVGFGVGTVGTLVGAGGGFLLVPFLIFYYRDPPIAASTVAFISLMAVCANAASGTIGYIRLRRIDYRTALAFAAATVPTAILGVFVVRQVNLAQFAIAFGGLLIAVGAFMLLRAWKRHDMAASPRTCPVNGTRRRIVDAAGQVYEYGFRMPLGIAVSVAIGFISSFLGIGGGIIHVPFLTQALGFPVQVATATSQTILAITAITGVVTHLCLEVPGVGWRRAGFIAAGSILGAQLGARLARRASSRAILFLLAIGLLLTGIRMILKGLHF